MKSGAAARGDRPQRARTVGSAGLAELRRDPSGASDCEVQHLDGARIDHAAADRTARAIVDEAVSEYTAAPSPVSAARARLAASEALSGVAAEAVQMHGGIAITWESDIQLYFKRAHGSAQLLGAPREQVRRLESELF